MSPEEMELLWMTGCAAVMLIMGVIAFVGYLKHKGANEDSAHDS